MIRVFIILLIWGLLLPSLVWSSDSLKVTLLSKRYRTEWNWVEYRISLTNTSDIPILNPEIRYFAENSLIQYCENREIDVNCTAIRYGDYVKDTLLTAAVDYSTWPYTFTPSVYSNWKYTVIKLKSSGLLYSGKTVEINFRIHKKDWSFWDSKNDFSYQKNADTLEPNYFIVVYDGSKNLLWGEDPTVGKRNADVILWSDRNGNNVITPFDRDTTATIPAGRFRLIKNNPLTSKERGLLSNIGIKRLEAGRIQEKSLLLFKADSAVKKSMLDSLVAGFYNAFVVDDTTKLKVNFIPEDLVKEVTTCDSNNHCQTQIIVRSEFDLEIACWPDISMPACKSIVQSCGGINALIDRSLILSTHTKSSITCLENQRDIRNIHVQRQGKPTLDLTRQAIKIDVLQNSVAWQTALQATQPTLEWLSDADYTGKGIVVGVYDTGIDFKHPAFNENSSGTQVARKIRADEVFEDGSIIEDIITTDNNGHGTRMAGIIGGNGYTSTGYQYRGIAPKVHFYSDSYFHYRQIGHVVNHSHTDSPFELGNYYMGKYVNAAYTMDKYIFENWKHKPCDNCDSLAKTSLYAASNNGGSVYEGHGTQGNGRQNGYHTILANSKNSIIVGNHYAVSGLRYPSSGMGPTWDGRIKPDIMAPGSSNLYSVSESNPLELYIDYIKIYRENASTPYFELDFEETDLDLANYNAKEHSIINDPINGEVFRIMDNRDNVRQTYIGWKLNQVQNILPTDELEIRLKKGAGSLGDRHNFGTVMFGNNESSFYDSYKKVTTFWNIDTDYLTTRVSLTNLSNPINVYYLRIDFNHEKSLVTPERCINANNCEYSMIMGGGTSAATAVVSGIAALMYERYQKMTKEPLEKKSMRNSTVKSILIHTAEDMEDTESAHLYYNLDIMAAEQDGLPHYTPYGKGPDFATGWGKVDGRAALSFIDNYDKNNGEFRRFKEFEIPNGHEKRWKIIVPSNRDKLRVTLVWDDAPGNENNAKPENYLDSKLVNDLDMYLISPSGKYFFPWRLEPLPTDNIDEEGNLTGDVKRSSGLENIKVSDIKDAERYCGANDELRYECFDHLNNVEVVDVDNPEKGTWQVVVRGTRVEVGNNKDSSAQIASVVSDFILRDSECQITHPYAPQSRLVCEYGLGDHLEHFVTFDPLTFVGSGDYIYLYDDSERLLGTYTGTQLAGKRIKVKSKKLKVVLDSDNDGIEGFGFSVKKIEHTPYSILPLLFEAAKQVDEEE
jgi:hypothetical protein